MVHQNGEHCWRLLQDQILISPVVKSHFLGVGYPGKVTFCSLNSLFVGTQDNRCAKFDIPIDFFRNYHRYYYHERNGVINIKVIKRKYVFVFFISLSVLLFKMRNTCWTELQEIAEKTYHLEKSQKWKYRTQHTMESRFSHWTRQLKLPNHTTPCFLFSTFLCTA